MIVLAVDQQENSNIECSNKKVIDKDFAVTNRITHVRSHSKGLYFAKGLNKILKITKQ